MPGRKRKPIEIKRREGNRAKVARAKLDHEVKAFGIPRMPTHLSADEQLLWADTVAAMPAGLFKRADEALLETFAVEWATYREVTRRIKQTGFLVQGPQGLVRNPLLVVQNNASRAIHRVASEMGLSPAARARLTNIEAAEDDPMALLLGDDLDPAGAWSTLPRTRN